MSIDFMQTTIGNFFDSSKKFYSIPQYQRAYSWEQEHWKQFFDDIKEQAENENDYFLGNILLERRENEFEIIDGQQRITTLVIFMRAVINISKEKQLLPEKKISDCERFYIKDNDVTKLKTASYDNDFFNTVIVKNEKCVPKTSSQKRIIDAKNYFLKALKTDKLSLEKILMKTENAVLNILTLTDKKQAALMFELQNNRGISLTELEKLKAYFMYQTYINSLEEKTEGNINDISNMFNQIYQDLHSIQIIDIGEDDILRYHCHAYMPSGYGYRLIEEIKQELAGQKEKKVAYINNFVKELQKTVSHLKQFCNQDENNPLIRLLDHKFKMRIPAFIYPFIIKGYKFIAEKNISDLFDFLELLVFRDSVIYTRAKITTRLNSIMKEFKGDVQTLKSNIHHQLEHAWHWSNERFDETLNLEMNDNSAIHYILWEYEDSIQTSDDAIIKTMRNEKVKKEIEHIAPQTEESDNPSSGYPSYEGKFTNEKYLHCLGNLMLIAKPHNASIGNEPFAEKLKSYMDNRLLKQQIEIADFVKEHPPEWSMSAIDERHEKIVEFIKKRWSFE